MLQEHARKLFCVQFQGQVRNEENGGDDHSFRSRRKGKENLDVSWLLEKIL